MGRAPYAGVIKRRKVPFNSKKIIVNNRGGQHSFPKHWNSQGRVAWWRIRDEEAEGKPGRCVWQTIPVICAPGLCCCARQRGVIAQPRRRERHAQMASTVYKESSSLGAGSTFAWVLYFLSYMLAQSSRTRLEFVINGRSWFYLSRHKVRWNQGSSESVWTSAAYNLNEKLGHFPVFIFTSLVPAVLHTLKKNFPVKATRL